VLEHLLSLHALELAPAQCALFDGVLFRIFPVTVFGWNPHTFEFGRVGLAGPLGIALLRLASSSSRFMNNR
jgi:hypothetical protein